MSCQTVDADSSRLFAQIALLYPHTKVHVREYRRGACLCRGTSELMIVYT